MKDSSTTWQTSGAFVTWSGRTLLCRRPESKACYPGAWDTPGGHLEPGESPESALSRELREELGIEVTGAEYLTTLADFDAHSGRRYLHHMFIVTRWRGDLARPAESVEHGWFTAEQIERLAEQVVRPTRTGARAWAAWLQRRQQTLAGGRRAAALSGSRGAEQGDPGERRS